MAPLSNIYWRIFLKSSMSRYGRKSYRFISTTPRKADTTEACDPQKVVIKKDFSKPFEDGNWVSFGFNHQDKGDDRFRAHFLYFSLFSYALCGSAFVFYYAPDKKRADWVRREAFIRLHEREQLGLEPVDPNYVDPAKVVLPPDEELSEEDIVI